MGKYASAALGAWLLAAGIGFGQDGDDVPPARLPIAPAKTPLPKGPLPKELPPVEAPPALESAPVLVAEPAQLQDIIWFRPEVLFISIGNTVNDIPLLTTGNPADGPLAGAIGQPDTRVLQNAHDLTNQDGRGLRFTLGAWLDNAHVWGVEGTGFVMIQAENTTTQLTDKTGNPPLYLPAFNVQLDREDSAIIGDPLQQFGAGGVQLQSKLSLWGFEVSGLCNLHRDDVVEWNVLSGVRYLDLRESIRLSAKSRDLILNQGITLDDRFDTSNQFLAYQFGTRVRYRHNKWLIDVAGKIAVGGNNETVSIDGVSTKFGPDAFNPGAFPGGFFAQPSNMGSSSHTVLAAMPSLEVRLGYQFTPRFIATVGYDLWYLSHTVRAGNQIDRNLNLSQSPVLAAPAPPGPPAPLRTDEAKDLTIQSISVGLEVRY